jgi:hypothetical protein
MDKSSAGYTTPGFPSQANVNHLETGSQPLSRFMQGLQESYTQYFNRKHHKVARGQATFSLKDEVAVC